MVGAGAAPALVGPAAALVLAGSAAALVFAGSAAALVFAGSVAAAALVADAASPEVFDSVAGLASAEASAGLSALAPPQAPFAAQLALAPLPSPAGTSDAWELAWLPAHALSTAPEPMTANAAANLLIFIVMFSLCFQSSVDRRRIDERDSCPLRMNIAVVSRRIQK